MIFATLILFRLIAAEHEAHAANISGKSCKKMGAKAIDGPKRNLSCENKNKKLIWKLVARPTTTFSTNSQPSSQPASCNAAPIFTNDFIDPKYVRDVTPIGQQSGGGGVISVRSYVHPSATYLGIQLQIMLTTDARRGRPWHMCRSSRYPNWQNLLSLEVHLTTLNSYFPKDSTIF